MYKHPISISRRSLYSSSLAFESQDILSPLTLLSAEACETLPLSNLSRLLPPPLCSQDSPLCGSSHRF